MLIHNCDSGENLNLIYIPKKYNARRNDGPGFYKLDEKNNPEKVKQNLFIDPAELEIDIQVLNN